MNPNVQHRHQWDNNKCSHCGLTRKLEGWKELRENPAGRTELIYRQKVFYFFEGVKLEKRPRCIGKGVLKESDYVAALPYTEDPECDVCKDQLQYRDHQGDLINCDVCKNGRAWLEL